MNKFYLAGVLVVLLFSVIAFTNDTNPLVGKWEYSTTSQGQPFKLLAIFRANSTFDGFINKKEFVSGTYHMKHDTMYISDPTCNAKYEGIYKVQFLGQLDSLRFHVIQDTCTGRREGTDGFLFKKITTVK
ncbi:hypothetical protein ACFGVS_24655 [Mucilaginibacter sp. AW1-7]|uniref:hypothetical protein n=1 Tax=Mucilaginibacter sp. AW1-7 TaxID=3349874 RepID=UPI003F733F55